MRAFGLAVLAVALTSALIVSQTACGEVDDNIPCNDSTDCDEGYLCRKDTGEANGVCKLRAGEPCIRPAECNTGACSDGFCQ